LEVDDEIHDVEADHDSVFDDDANTETTTLASSVLKYRVENGRTYHAYKAGAYFMPNDETENDRLDLQHNLVLLMQDNKLHLCPAGKDKPLGRVLDAGCGTGIWTLEYADEHPETTVVGTDLSANQPKLIPPNVEFFVDDLEDTWTFENNPFDLVYMRMMSGSIKDWPKLIGQAYRNITPGGWLELCDTVNPVACDDGTLPPDSALVKWNQLLVEASKKLGATLDCSLHYREWMIAEGFTNVVQVNYKWPINSWPKDPKYKNLGLWSHQNAIEGLQAVSLMLFTNVLGWSTEEAEILIAGVRRDLKNRHIHAYWPVRVVYGQKPE